jgi:hypothetical protein
MPKKKPVNNAKGAGGKAAIEEQTKKNKIKDDKTFGMKNKNKSKKVQQHIASINATKKDTGGGFETRVSNAQKLKLEEERKAAEMRLLFKTVPKSKAELVKERDIKRKAARVARSAKIDLYADPREAELAAARKQETNAKWDMAKLASVVDAKHGNEKTATTTDIVCKHFLEAVEKQLYGWFWKCPIGGATCQPGMFRHFAKVRLVHPGETCKYKHCLPPGFIMKKKKSHGEDDSSDEEEMTLEEIIEEKRAALTAAGVPGPRSP